MIKNSIVVSLVFLSFFNSPQIIEIKNIEEVLDYITSESCCIWDIDNTILEPDNLEQIGSEQWFTALIQSLQKEHSFDKAKQQAIIDYCILMLSLKVKPVETNENITLRVTQKVASLCTSFGFTARSMILAPTTYKWLTTYEIVFSAAWPDQGFIINNHDIMLYKSTIYCSGYKNATTLFTILDFFNYHPNHLVMVDDKEYYLKLIDAECTQRNIPFIGLRYGYLDSKVEEYLKQAYLKQAELE